VTALPRYLVDADMSQLFEIAIRKTVGNSLINRRGDRVLSPTLSHQAFPGLFRVT